MAHEGEVRTPTAFGDGHPRIVLALRDETLEQVCDLLGRLNAILDHERDDGPPLGLREVVLLVDGVAVHVKD